MNDLNLERAKAKLKSLETFLHMCDWSCDGRSLDITCSDILASQLTQRCDGLSLKFEHIEKVIINGVIVFEQTIHLPEPSVSTIYGCADELTELFLPVLTEGMKVTPEAMFPEHS
jgi:hypothetical protein